MDSQKTQLRRKVKQKRKQRIKEKKYQQRLKNIRTSAIEKKGAEEEKTAEKVVTQEALKVLSETEKCEIIKQFEEDIISSPEDKVFELGELLMFCGETNFKVVIEAIKSLTRIFVDILPSYKIQLSSNQKEKISQKVKKIRTYESTLIQYYSKFIHILKEFMKLKLKKLIPQQDTLNEIQGTNIVLLQLKQHSIICLCKLLKSLPTLNLNHAILEIIISKLASFHKSIRNECANTLIAILQLNDKTLLEFKQQIMKKIAKELRTQKHSRLDPHLIEMIFCSFSKILIKPGSDEEKDYQEKMKLQSQLKKLHKKKPSLATKEEIKETQNKLNQMKLGNVGLEYDKIKKFNQALFEELLGMYLDILKNKKESHLIQPVLKAIPTISPFLNGEMISNLVSLLSDYVKDSFNSLTENRQIKSSESVQLKLEFISAGILCSVRLMNIESGTGFDVEERSCSHSLYKFLWMIILYGSKCSNSIFLNIAESFEILFLKRKSFQIDIISAFIKRLAQFSCHVAENWVGPILLLIKQSMDKYWKLTKMIEVEAEPNALWLKSIFNPKEKEDENILNAIPEFSSESNENILQELGFLRKVYGSNWVIKDLIHAIRENTLVDMKLSGISPKSLIVSYLD